MRRHSLTLGAALAALVASAQAHAQAPGLITNETWVCTDKAQAATEYLVKDGRLVVQPQGAAGYKLLSDTTYGLVAVDYSTDLELGYVDPYVATVLIDRVNGNYTAMHGWSGGTPEVRTGKCRMVTTKALNASAGK